MRTWTAAADSFFFSLHPLLRLLAIAVVMALMAIIARKRRMLTRDGTAAAVLIGTVVSYIGGLSGLVMLLFFFLPIKIMDITGRYERVWLETGAQLPKLIERNICIIGGMGGEEGAGKLFAGPQSEVEVKEFFSSFVQK